MAGENLILASEFCSRLNIEISFIQSLQEYGLIEVMTIEGSGFIEEEQLEDIEKMVRLHYDLQINLEGIDAIHHLLEQMKDLQHQMASLKNRLRLYEQV
ncbi:MAG TPA: chaperone modulator CbpM [Flavisolibacter sp.]|nr:chaperone modulator CbpM [Flavisolibacter sp.]